MVKKKFLSVILIGAIVAMAFAGCKGTTNTSTNDDKVTEKETEKETGKETQTPTDAKKEDVKEFTYPMGAGKKLSFWGDLVVNLRSTYSNLGETPFAKGWAERTGVEVEYQHPPAGQNEEQFSLILADGDLPDMMEYNWLHYPGGPEKAIKDGVIIKLNDVFKEYCPNITKYLAEHPEVDKMIKTDDGNYYAFPFIRGDERLCNTIGVMLRKDYLSKYNLEIPETIDEWHNVLTVFKENGVSSPLCYEYDSFKEQNPFMYAFGATRSFYLGNDGKVHFGATDKGYKDYLETFHKWYSEGLLDPDLASLKFDQVSAKMTNGEGGASIGFAGSRMGTWITSAIKNNPDYMLTSAPQPSLVKGEKSEFGYVDSPYRGQASVAITTSCKDIERAARLLDYGYSEEGHMYFNFGTEGVSYTMIDGYPTYTDLILKNPEGLSVAQAMSAHIRGNYNGSFVQDVRYVEQFYTYPDQNASLNVWGTGSSNGIAHRMPPITPTSEESKEFSKIMNEINTYRDEMTLKYILGTESLDTFDEYVANINKMGLDRALEIENAALARYQSR